MHHTALILYTQWPYLSYFQVIWTCLNLPHAEVFSRMCSALTKFWLTKKVLKPHGTDPTTTSDVTPICPTETPQSSVHGTISLDFTLIDKAIDNSSTIPLLSTVSAIYDFSTLHCYLSCTVIILLLSVTKCMRIPLFGTVTDPQFLSRGWAHPADRSQYNGGGMEFATHFHETEIFCFCKN